MSSIGCCVCRVSNMSAHLLSNLLNELGKKDKTRDLSSLLISIIQEHEC